MSQTKAELVNGLSLNTALADAVTVDSSGKVGIGTSSPSTNLHVKGPDGSAPKITLSEGTSESAIRSTASGTSSDIRLMTSVSGSQTTKLIVDYTGKVGVGTTSPTEPLHVNGGDICISHTTAPNLRIVKADDSSGSASNRAFFGLASGGNNYMNGTGDGDTVIVGAEGSLQHMHFGFGTSIKLTLRDDGRIFNAATYNNTTGSSANVSMPNNTGEFFRSTSSRKYKNNITTLTDTLADKILNCRPVSYNSTCAADDKSKVFYGLIAEEVHDVDTSLVFYNNEPETPEPEGVQYDRFIPALINLVKRQKAQIETLETRVATLEAA